MRVGGRGFGAVSATVGSLVLASAAHAVGTTAGLSIDTQASASYSIQGAPQPDVVSNIDRLAVDEILDSLVTSDDAAPVSVGSPSTANALTFSIANTGNGTEPMRLVAEPQLSGDAFDPTQVAIYLETNGTAGLQTGAGGDAQYTAGANDPVLAANAVTVAYVVGDVPAAQPSGALARVGLRAVAKTIFTESGTDDPSNAAFPAPGTTYPNAGDSGPQGPVAAVVGKSADRTALALRAEGALRVSSAVVGIAKTVRAVTDPSGGAKVVPGSTIDYQISVDVSGSGTATGLVITDPIPTELDYVPGSLSVSALPAGENADDDFLPTNVDHTGFDAATHTVTVSLGDAVGGGAPTTIAFKAKVR